MNTLYYVRPGNKFVPKIDLFERQEVNGLGENELFTYLKVSIPATFKFHHFDIHKIRL